MTRTRARIGEAATQALQVQSIETCALGPSDGWTIDREQFHHLDIRCVALPPPASLFLSLSDTPAIPLFSLKPLSIQLSGSAIISHSSEPGHKRKCFIEGV